MTHGTVVFETITSEVLKDNPLHDSPTRRVPVYVPPNYDELAIRYPTLYLLTGFTGRGTMLLNDAAWEENIAERLDRLIGQKNDASHDRDHARLLHTLWRQPIHQLFGSGAL